jgi:hypothetical protein
VEVGSLVARRVDPTHKYRVIYITTDYKAISVSKHSPKVLPQTLFALLLFSFLLLRCCLKVTTFFFGSTAIII